MFRRRRVPSKVQQSRIDRLVRIVIEFFRLPVETCITGAENENDSTWASFCFGAEARKESRVGKGKETKHNRIERKVVTASTGRKE